MSLSAVEVEVWRKRHPLLHRVSLEVRPGELLAIVGPSGSGKSTLLRALAGEHLCRSGEVLLEGRPLVRWKLSARLRQLGFLPQYPSRMFGFTALDVALLGRTPQGLGRGNKEDVRIALAALAATGTRHLAARPCPSLSEGERQRVQLARVLAQLWEPPTYGNRYLLLDEPTTSLDPPHQNLVMALAARFAAQGGAVVASFHDVSLVRRHAHRVAVLVHGRQVDVGPPAQVLRPELVATAFGLDSERHEHPGSPAPLLFPTGSALELEPGPALPASGE